MRTYVISTPTTNKLREMYGAISLESRYGIAASCQCGVCDCMCSCSSCVGDMLTASAERGKLEAIASKQPHVVK